MEEQSAMPPVAAASKSETQSVTTAGRQPARLSVGAANEGETSGVTTAEEEPARSLIGAANEGETHGKSTEYRQSSCWLIMFFLEFCCGISKSGLWCGKRVKTGKYCIVHGKEY